MVPPWQSLPDGVIKITTTGAATSLEYKVEIAKIRRATPQEAENSVYVFHGALAAFGLKQIATGQQGGPIAGMVPSAAPSGREPRSGPARTEGRTRGLRNDEARDSERPSTS